MNQRYRPNVAGILQRPDDGRILIAERVGVAGAWQFPQGGIDPGEELEAAFAREMEEEIGLGQGDYEVVERRGGYRYEFPEHSPRRARFIGQEQTYFRCLMRAGAGDAAIRLDRHEREFADFRWILPVEFDLGWVPEFKREVYAAVMRDFFAIG